MGLMVPIGFCHRFALSACVLIVLALQLNSQTTSSPAQDLDYATLLTRLKQGDTNIDLPAFRTTTALKLGSAYAALEFRTHSQAVKFFTSGNYQAALELANQTLDRNYASLYGHSDARLACQKLGNAAEAALHEKLLNALADSIMRSGDGKSLETAWFVVDVPEEYFLVGSVLQLQAKSQSLVNKNGHAYDNVVAVDPTTNQSSSLWFNTDVDMGLFKSPSQNASPPNPSRPITAEKTTESASKPPSPAEGEQAVVRRGNFSLVEQSKGLWGVIWNLFGSYEVTPQEVVVTVREGTATLSVKQMVANRPVQLRTLQLGICYQTGGGQWSVYPSDGPLAPTVPLNDFTLDGERIYTFSSTTFKIPLPEKPLPAENWLCGFLWGQAKGSTIGNYPAHDMVRPLLVASHTESLVQQVPAVDCRGKVALASIPPGVLGDINNAINDPDRVVQIARAGGLKVSFTHNREGHVDSYFISNSLNGCMVASRSRPIP